MGSEEGFLHRAYFSALVNATDAACSVCNHLFLVPPRKWICPFQCKEHGKPAVVFTAPTNCCHICSGHVETRCQCCGRSMCRNEKTCCIYYNIPHMGFSPTAQWICRHCHVTMEEYSSSSSSTSAAPLQPTEAFEQLSHLMKSPLLRLRLLAQISQQICELGFHGSVKLGNIQFTSASSFAPSPNTNGEDMNEVSGDRKASSSSSLVSFGDHAFALSGGLGGWSLTPEEREASQLVDTIGFVEMILQLYFTFVLPPPSLPGEGSTVTATNDAANAVVSIPSLEHGIEMAQYWLQQQQQQGSDESSSSVNFFANDREILMKCCEWHSMSDSEKLHLASRTLRDFNTLFASFKLPCVRPVLNPNGKLKFEQSLFDSEHGAVGCGSNRGTKVSMFLGRIPRTPQAGGGSRMVQVLLYSGRKSSDTSCISFAELYEQIEFNLKTLGLESIQQQQQQDGQQASGFCKILSAWSSSSARQDEEETSSVIILSTPESHPGWHPLPAFIAGIGEQNILSSSLRSVMSNSSTLREEDEARLRRQLMRIRDCFTGFQCILPPLSKKPSCGVESTTAAASPADERALPLTSSPFSPTLNDLWIGGDGRRTFGVAVAPLSLVAHATELLIASKNKKPQHEQDQKNPDSSAFHRRLRQYEDFATEILETIGLEVGARRGENIAYKKMVELCHLDCNGARTAGSSLPSTPSPESSSGSPLLPNSSIPPSVLRLEEARKGFKKLFESLTLLRLIDRLHWIQISTRNSSGTTSRGMVELTPMEKVRVVWNCFFFQQLHGHYSIDDDTLCVAVINTIREYGENETRTFSRLVLSGEPQESIAIELGKELVASRQVKIESALREIVRSLSSAARSLLPPPSPSTEVDDTTTLGTGHSQQVSSCNAEQQDEHLVVASFIILLKEHKDQINEIEIYHLKQCIGACLVQAVVAGSRSGRRGSAAAAPTQQVEDRRGAGFHPPRLDGERMTLICSLIRGAAEPRLRDQDVDTDNLFRELMLTEELFLNLQKKYEADIAEYLDPKNNRRWREIFADLERGLFTRQDGDALDPEFIDQKLSDVLFDFQRKM